MNDTIITSTIDTGATWVSPFLQNTVDKPSEGDIFKQIVSLLGIKIANVKIEDGKVTIYGYRKKKKYIIEISGGSIVVKNEKGEQISKIFLLDGGTVTINPPYIVYPQPNTTTNIYPYQQPYTTTNGTYTIDLNSNIIDNMVVGNV